MTEKRKEIMPLKKDELKEIKGGIPYVMPVLIDFSEALTECTVGKHCDSGHNGSSCSNGQVCSSGTHGINTNLSDL